MSRTRNRVASTPEPSTALDPFDAGGFGGPPPGRRQAFTGSLDDLPLPDVLQMLLALKKSGILALTHGRGESSIVLADGLIVSCQPSRSAAPSNLFLPLRKRVEVTLLETLSEAGGTFAFTPAEETPFGCPPPSVDDASADGPLSPLVVVLDVLRILDERKSGRADDTVPDPKRHPLRRVGRFQMIRGALLERLASGRDTLVDSVEGAVAGSRARLQHVRSAMVWAIGQARTSSAAARLAILMAIVFLALLVARGSGEEKSAPVVVTLPEAAPVAAVAAPEPPAAQPPSARPPRASPAAAPAAAAPAVRRAAAPPSPAAEPAPTRTTARDPTPRPPLPARQADDVAAALRRLKSASETKPKPR